MPKGTRKLIPRSEEISGRVSRCERTYSAIKSVKEISPSSERLKKGTGAPPWRDALLLWELSESFLKNGTVRPRKSRQTFSCHLNRCCALQPRGFEMHYTSIPSSDKLVRPMPSIAKSTHLLSLTSAPMAQSCASLISLFTHPWGTYTRCQKPTQFLTNTCPRHSLGELMIQTSRTTFLHSRVGPTTRYEKAPAAHSSMLSSRL